MPESPSPPKPTPPSPGPPPEPLPPNPPQVPPVGRQSDSPELLRTIEVNHPYPLAETEIAAQARPAWPRLLRCDRSLRLSDMAGHRKGSRLFGGDDLRTR